MLRRKRKKAQAYAHLKTRAVGVIASETTKTPLVTPVHATQDAILNGWIPSSLYTWVEGKQVGPLRLGCETPLLLLDTLHDKVAGVKHVHYVANRVGISQVDFAEVVHTPLVEGKKGGFGKVSVKMFLGVQVVALKEFKEGHFGDMLRELLYALLASQASRHVFPPLRYGIRYSSGHVYPFLVFPYGGKTLWEFVDCDTLDLPLKRNMCVLLLEAVKELHSADLVHGDIKGNNVLVLNKPLGLEGVVVSLIDFSLTSTVDKTTTMYARLTEQEKVERLKRAYWIAPELARGFNKSKTSDMYSVGFLLLDVLIPKGEDRRSVYAGKKELETYIPYMDSRLATLTMNCFGERIGRPTAQELYSAFKDSEIVDGIMK